MIDFNSFEIKRGHVLIEYPTKTDSGFILIKADNSTAQSGWFKVVKSGKRDNAAALDEDIIKEVGTTEAFVYFHHQPYEFDEIVFKSRRDQKAEMEKKEGMEGIVISDGLGGLKNASELQEPERVFALVREHDILFTRERK
jgi:hypothetical protein